MQRRVVYVAALLLWMFVGIVPAQTITGVEYYIDTDPGIGNATRVPVFAAAQVDVSFVVDLSGVTEGIHRLYIRAVDSNDHWGKPEIRTFYVNRYDLDEVTNATRAEYYFDSDPGVGNGANIPISDANSVTTTFSADLSALTPGLHILYVRSCDEEGRWSMPQSHHLFIERNLTSTPTPLAWGEFFIDTDPGRGNGNAITFTSVAQNTWDAAYSVDLSGVSEGLHTLYVRVADDNGVEWRLQPKRFYVNRLPAETPSNLVEMEYFFDVDPGVGEGTSITTGVSTEADLAFLVDVSALSPGNHRFYMRARDSEGRWGFPTVRVIRIEREVATEPAPLIERTQIAFMQAGTASDTTAIEVEAPSGEVAVEYNASLLDLTLGEEYRANIVAYDNQGTASIPYVHTFTYNDFNSVPDRIATVPDVEVPEDFTTFDLAQVDTLFEDINIPFGDHLSFTATSLRNLVVVNIVEGILQVSSQEDIYGLDSLLIVATDDSLATAADTVLIVINQINDPPLAFHRVSPASNTTFQEDSVEVIWTTSGDIDPEASVQYVLQWSDQESFDLFQEELLTDTSFVIGELEMEALRARGDAPTRRHELSRLQKAGREIKRASSNSPARTWTSRSLSTVPSSKGTEPRSRSKDEVRGPTANNALDELPDDRTIFWRVKAVDDSNAVTWADGSDEGWSFHIDQPDAPLVFDLLTPSSGAVVEESSVTLLWRMTSDPDPYDAVRYDVWLDTLATLATAIQVSDSLVDTSLVFTSLLDDHDYFWCVRATDSNTPGTWTDTLAFSTNIPDAPASFTPAAPEDDAVLTASNVIFRWHPALDPDPDDTVRYDFWLSLDSLITVESPVADSLTDTTYIYSELEDDTDYWWTIFAWDSQNNGTSAADTFKFHLAIPEPPNTFSLLAPDSGLVFPDARDFPLLFGWENNGDPDPGDGVTYTLEISTDPDFTNPIQFDAGEEDSVEVDTLERSIYWWRVIATDNDDSTTYSSETWLLDVTLIVEERWSGLPTRYALESAYPNPFNPTVTVVVGLPDPSELKVEVYNLLGRRVAVLANDSRQPGYQILLWNATGHASGVYFVRASVPGKMEDRRKIVLIR